MDKKKIELEECPECEEYKMKKGSDMCNKCKWVKCRVCDKFLLKSKGYDICFNCYTEQTEEIKPEYKKDKKDKKK